MAAGAQRCQTPRLSACNHGKNCEQEPIRGSTLFARLGRRHIWARLTGTEECARLAPGTAAAACRARKTALPPQLRALQSPTYESGLAQRDARASSDTSQKKTPAGCCGKGFLTWITRYVYSRRAPLPLPLPPALRFLPLFRILRERGTTRLTTRLTIVLTHRGPAQ